MPLNCSSGAVLKPENSCAYDTGRNRKLDFRAQSCGLSLPTLNSEVGSCRCSLYAASSPAVIASTGHTRAVPETG